MKTTEKYGICSRKHSVNVLKKTVIEYFQEMSENKEDVADLINETLATFKTDGLEACTWAQCKEIM